MKIKKCQMRIQEMSFMIIALVIFFFIVLLFFLAFSINNIKKDVDSGTREKAILLISRLSASPEFSCAEGLGEVCVDADKIIALMNNPAYLTFWDVEGLRLERIYPYDNKTTECNLANYPRCNIFTIVRSNKTSSIIEDSSFVSLCRKDYKNGYNYNKCELGKIIVSTKKEA